MIESNFKMEQLGQYAYVQGGYAYEKNDFCKIGIPVLKIKNIRMRYVDVSETDYVNQDLAKKTSRFFAQPTDILISMTGSTINVPSSVVGRVARYTGAEQSYLINQRVGRFVITKPSELDKRYLFFVLLHPDLQFTLAINASGSANQANISGKQIESLQIPLPPLAIQKRIAEILGRLDDKIELNRHINATLEDMAQRLYKHWFVDFGPFQEGEFVESALGLIPQGWSVERLGDGCNLIMGMSPESKFYNEDGMGLPFHQGVADFNDRFPSHKRYCTVETRLATKGDILVSVRAPVGRINIADRKIVIGRGLAAINHKQGYNSFLHYQLQTIFKEEDSMGSGTVFNAVSKKDLEVLPLIIPSETITSKFNTRVDMYDKQIEMNTQQNNHLATIRDYLLPRLLSGELSVEETANVP